MKLKEKLADSAWLKTSSDICHVEFEAIYLAGFEKAREMAAQNCEKVKEIVGPVSTTDWDVNAIEMRQLGEEEVG